MSSTSIKICHYITTISRGGAENQLLLLVENQIKSGNQVTVIPLKGGLELYEDFTNLGAKVETKLVDKKFISQIIRMLVTKNRKFDIHHAHLPQAELLLAFSPIKNYIITRHFGGQFYPDSNKLISRILSRISSSRAKKIIAISESVKNLLIDLKEVSSLEKIKVVPYGFNSKAFVKNYSKKVKENSQSYTVGTLARLSVEKDLPILIKAFKILQSKDFGKKYILSIFGEGEMRDQIESLIKNLGLEKNVQLMGRTMNPAEELSKFDLFVLPSKFEGFGLVLLEAMAFNIPIIASNISTAKEVLGEDGAGVFFEQGNENDLADKILNIKTHLDSSFIEKQKIRLNFFNDTVMEQRVRQAYEL